MKIIVGLLAFAILCVLPAFASAQSTCDCGLTGVCVCPAGTCACPSCPAFRWQRFADGDTKQVALMHGNVQVGAYRFSDRCFAKISNGVWSDPCKCPTTAPGSCAAVAITPPPATYYYQTGGCADGSCASGSCATGAVGSYSFGSASGGCANGSCSGGSSRGRGFRR